MAFVEKRVDARGVGNHSGATDANVLLRRHLTREH